MHNFAQFNIQKGKGKVKLYLKWHKTCFHSNLALFYSTGLLQEKLIPFEYHFIYISSAYYFPTWHFTEMRLSVRVQHDSIKMQPVDV